MHAAIFDIDGTLIDSCEVDNAMYVEAIQHILGASVRLRDAWELCGSGSDPTCASPMPRAAGGRRHN